MADAFDGMSRDEGYWYDHRGVQVGAAASWEDEKDYDISTVYVMWDGEVGPEDAYHGAEDATTRFRRYR